MNNPEIHHAESLRHLFEVLKQEHQDLQLLKLHLYTEQLLNQMVSIYLRTDEPGVRKLQLGYARKVNFVELAHLVPAEGCELLRKLNSLRQKIAHEIDYTVTQEDTDKLFEGIGGHVAESVPGQTAFQRLAPFLGGYLSGGVKMASLVADRISTISRSDFIGFP